jgi:hypothetical protein
MPCRCISPKMESNSANGSVKVKCGEWLKGWELNGVKNWSGNESENGEWWSRCRRLPLRGISSGSGGGHTPCVS